MKPDVKLKILFLSDTHIGLDWPVKPRVRLRRRGDDFYNNFLLALKPALAGQADLVVHGGDLLNRSRLPHYIVQRAFEPLLRVADAGVPVYVVPGNHERSAFRLSLFEKHQNVHVFDRPRYFIYEKKGRRLCLIGFPFVRGDIRGNFPLVLAEAGYPTEAVDATLLCMHHPVDGAKVGPVNFTFRKRKDTIDPATLPHRLDVVLSGHIHRRQVLNFALNTGSLPVIYSGSVERTALAEKDESKGYVMLEGCLDGQSDRMITWRHRFIDLPARPMKQLQWDATGMSLQDFRQKYAGLMRSLPADAIVYLKLVNGADSGLEGQLPAARLRSWTPASMNVRLQWVD